VVGWGIVLHEITYFQVWGTFEEIKKQAIDWLAFHFDVEDFFSFFVEYAKIMSL